MQQQLVQAESRREQLEAENQNLRLRSETAAGEKDGEMEDSVGKINTHKMYSNSSNGLVIFRFPNCGTNYKHTDMQTFMRTELNSSSPAGRRTHDTFVSLRAKLQMPYYNSKEVLEYERVTA